MSRIAVSVDPAFDAMGNAFRYATRVTVSTATGSQAQETLHRSGSPEMPLTTAQPPAKFELLAATGRMPKAVGGSGTPCRILKT